MTSYPPIQKILIASLMVLPVHQYEEYALPGGGPVVINRGFYEEETLYRQYPGNWNSIMIVNLSAYIFYALALALALGDWNIRENMLLGSSFFIFLHFFEEFGFPGGFPYIGMKVELQITDMDARHWPLNQVNAMFGNFCFAVLVYLLPLFLPNVRFLTLAAIFAFAEVLMHLVVFNIALKSWYNPGLLTAVFGLLPISLWYFSQVWGQHLYGWRDAGLAIVWIIFKYWLAFRSPFTRSWESCPTAMDSRKQRSAGRRDI